VTNSVDVMETEQLTVQRALAGDQAAMRALWTRHAPHIDVVVRRLVGNDTDLAADVASTAYPVTAQPLARRTRSRNNARAYRDHGTVSQVTEYERRRAAQCLPHPAEMLSMVEHASCLIGH
jgi:hypothetical protein